MFLEGLESLKAKEHISRVEGKVFKRVSGWRQTMFAIAYSIAQFNQHLNLTCASA
jgi:hypothetical protein